MLIVKKDEVIYLSRAELTNNDVIKSTLYDAEAWIDLPENLRCIITFEELNEWYKEWDQSDDDCKYDDVCDYIIDCLGN